MNGYNSPGNYKGNPNLHGDQGLDIFGNMSWTRYAEFDSETTDNVLANKPAHFVEQ